MSKKIPFASSLSSHALLALCFVVGLGCSDDSSGNGGSTSSASAGRTGSGGAASGGASNTSESAGSGGRGGASSASESAGGGSKPGSTSSGGKSATGGSSTAIETSATGGKGGTGGSTGGLATTGGTSKTGGTTGTGAGGTTTKTGGTSGGGSAIGGTAAGGTGGSTSTGAPGGAKPSEGCGKTPSKVTSAIVGQANPVNTVSVGGTNREFLVRWPSNYDKNKPYPLHIGLHGANGNLAENGKDNFGLWSLAKDSFIFVTLSGVSTMWNGPRDLPYADEVLKQVESELCIDTSRVMLEGFSMGAAMSWYITCSRPGVYRAVVGHSGGGVDSTSLTCSPVAYLGSLGTQESGNSQKTQSDRFAQANGCTIETLPTAPAGKHVCTPYKGCKDGFPVTWCSFDGGHGFTPKDSGASTTWVPAAVWDFISQL